VQAQTLTQPNLVSVTGSDTAQDPDSLGPLVASSVPTPTLNDPAQSIPSSRESSNPEARIDQHGATSSSTDQKPWTDQDNHTFVDLVQKNSNMEVIKKHLQRNWKEITTHMAELTGLSSEWKAIFSVGLNVEKYEPWTDAEDVNLKKLYMQGVSVTKIAIQLNRPDNAIRSRAAQLLLTRTSPSPWLEEDKKIREGMAANLTSDQIYERYFKDTPGRNLRIVKERLRILKMTPTAIDNRQPLDFDILRIDESLVLNGKEHLRMVHTDLLQAHPDISIQDKEDITALMENMDWPQDAYSVDDIMLGSQEGSQLAWSEVDNVFLMALRRHFGLSSEVITDVFFIDREPEECEGHLQALIARQNPGQGD
jgi:hypothetical protein